MVVVTTPGREGCAGGKSTPVSRLFLCRCCFSSLSYAAAAAAAPALFAPPVNKLAADSA